MYIVRQTEEFQRWLDGLRDRRAQVRIAARIRFVEAGNLGDWAPLGGEVIRAARRRGPGVPFVFYPSQTGCHSPSMRGRQVYAETRH
jgi:putative addiction module killer protein